MTGLYYLILFLEQNCCRLPKYFEKILPAERLHQRKPSSVGNKIVRSEFSGTPFGEAKTTARPKPFQQHRYAQNKKINQHAPKQHHYILVKLLVLVRHKKGRPEKCGP
jgi:hypothetical protein